MCCLVMLCCADLFFAVTFALYAHGTILLCFIAYHVRAPHGTILLCPIAAHGAPPPPPDICCWDAGIRKQAPALTTALQKCHNGQTVAKVECAELTDASFVVKAASPAECQKLKAQASTTCSDVAGTRRACTASHVPSQYTHRCA